MLSLSGRSRTALFVLMGFAVGAAAWSGQLWTLALLLFLPVVLHYGTTTQTPARDNAAAILAYHAGSTWTLLPGARLFFGNTFRPLDTLALWIAVILVLSVPWLLVRFFRAERVWWGLVLAMAVASVLPTGIANPITAAGVLFPGTAWAGLLLTFILFGAIAARPRQALFTGLCCAAFCNVIYRGMPRIPVQYEAVNTNYGGSGLRGTAPLKEFANARDIQHRALASQAKVIVFPETVIHRWNDATDMFWQNTFDELEKQGKTVFVGAEKSIPTNRHQYLNVIEVRGAQRAEYRQRIPLPYAMWRPLSHDGVPLYFFGPSVVNIDGHDVAPLICYEQLLIEPVLKAMVQRPQILVGLANDYWARGTSIPAIQRSALSAWSRLFWIPSVSAVNQ